MDGGGASLREHNRFGDLVRFCVQAYWILLYCSLTLDRGAKLCQHSAKSLCLLVLKR